MLVMIMIIHNNEARQRYLRINSFEILSDDAILIPET